MSFTFQWACFSELQPLRLYQLLQLRSAVFVLEQTCLYPDMDGCDPQCEHLCAVTEDDRLVGTLRLLPPGLKFPPASLGRLAVAAEMRGQGIARQLMLAGLQRLAERYPEAPVQIGGQRYLERFYQQLGFVTTTAPYLEDGIWHVDMMRSAPILSPAMRDPSAF